MIIVRSIGYSFIICWLIAFFRVEPMFSLFNKFPISEGWLSFISIAGWFLVFIVIFRRLKRLFFK